MLRDADGGSDNQNGGMQVDDEEDGAGEKDEMAEKEALSTPERDRPPSPPVVPGTNAAAEQGGGVTLRGEGRGNQVEKRLKLLKRRWQSSRWW